MLASDKRDGWSRRLSAWHLLLYLLMKAEKKLGDMLGKGKGRTAIARTFESNWFQVRPQFKSIIENFEISW